MSTPRWYIVRVERITSYRVKARSADQAIDAFSDDQECDQQTTDMSAELDDDQKDQDPIRNEDR